MSYDELAAAEEVNRYAQTVDSSAEAAEQTKKEVKIRKTERLDKVLAHNGFGSRRDVKKLLRSGSVLVNGETCVNSEVQVDIENDTITAAGKTLAAVGNIYLMMNKPCGVICSTKDDYSRTVIDILPEPVKDFV